MTTTMNAQELARFAQSLPARIELDHLRVDETLLYDDGRVVTYYAPFDHINKLARIAIVGVTPGPTQLIESFRTVRAAAIAGRSMDDAFAAVKAQASFKGMRTTLGRWLDSLGLNDALGVTRCESLFAGPDMRLLHTTSAIRYPTFIRRGDDLKNYSGTAPSPVDHEYLRSMVAGLLCPELTQIKDATIVPLGKGANAAVQWLCDEGLLEPSRCLLGLPHPSPASPYREDYFEAARPRLRAQLA